MIEIKEKSSCCGCNACGQICPKQCISMKRDEEGFLYPTVDSTTCINCGLCEKVCPILNQSDSKKPIVVYASKNKDENIRLKSSSGGIFTLLAERIISEGGVVFGAKFDQNWNVIHDYTETYDGINAFRGSKYVQSIIGNNYKLAKQFLDDDRKVLFSGTPCQIAGLKKYLRKEYGNLLTVEVVCHGVPSPMIWEDYLNYRIKQFADKQYINSPSNDSGLTITDIFFRDKTNGWNKYNFRIRYNIKDSITQHYYQKTEINPARLDLYMNGFLNNLYIRPSCYQCIAKQGKSNTDISIADYWNVQSVHKRFDDNKGCGLILLYTNKATEYYNNISCAVESIKSQYDKAIMYNHAIIGSATAPALRDEFWTLYKISGIDAISTICNRIKKPLYRRAVSKIRSLLVSKLK